MRNYRGISWVDVYIFGSKDDRAYYKEGVQITKLINADLKEIMRHKEKMINKRLQSSSQMEINSGERTS